MTCQTVPAGPGVMAIVCGRGIRPMRRCRHCHVRVADRLCDYPLTLRSARQPTRTRTCDAPLCTDCAVVVLALDGEDLDVCPLHPPLADAVPA